MLGWHWLAVGRGGDVERLADLDAVQGAVSAIVDVLALRPVAPVTSRPIEGGIAAVVLLAESHLAIHTQASDGVAWVDLFTCGELDPQPAVALLRAHLGLTLESQELKPRGPSEVRA